MNDKTPFSLEETSDEKALPTNSVKDDSLEDIAFDDLHEPRLDSDNTSKPELSASDSLRSANQHKKYKRDASYEMTDEEYYNELSRVNEDASHKHYVFFVGMPGAGKSYVIASLLRHMTEYLEGNVSLDHAYATEVESTLYNRMIAMFDNPLNGIERTGSEDFHEFRLDFRPKDNSLKPITVTFIDTSGENLTKIYTNGTTEYSGKLPDFLQVILDSNVNKMFVFVFDPDYSREELADKSKNPQAVVLKSFYDLVIRLQEKKGMYYNKLLLLSKSDRLDPKELEKFERSPSQWAQAPEHKISSFAQGYFNERKSNPRSQNSAIFYTLGRFNSRNYLEEFNNRSAEKLFNWIYKNITDQTLKKEGPGFWKKLLAALLGYNW